MLVARLFGPLELSVDGRDLGPRDLGGIKPRQLLEILLVERGHVVPKDRLAELLWGHSPPVHVGAALDTYASTLRRRLEPDRQGSGRYVLGGGGGLLVPAKVVEVDLDRFDRLVEVAERLARREDRGGARKSMEVALALVRGQVLEDEPYASWALRLRDLYAQRALAARVAAAEHALAVGDDAAALTHAQLTLSLDPVREAAHRIVMRACYRLARQDEALRAYERCRLALAEELGVDPLPETTQLHDAILRHDTAALSGPHAPSPPASIGGARPPSPTTPQPSSEVEVRAAASTDPVPSWPLVQDGELPLLGRDGELDALTTEARRALAGAGGLVLVEGEAGIGKSRLVSELLAHLQPVRVGTGKCAEPDRDLPYVPLAAALRELGVPALAEAGTLPALGEILPELPESGLPPEAARIRALESAAAALRQLAPVVVVVDDLQWADASSVAAFGYLRRRCAGYPVLLVGALRPEEVPVDSPLSDLATSLRVLLGPLTGAELAPLGPQAARLYDRSGGHPLWLLELVRAGDQHDDGALPSQLAELLLARCRRAGARAHRVLAAASVLGRPFDPDLVAALVNEDPLHVAELLEELCDRGLVRPVGQRFGFRHDLVSEALAAAVSPARRRLLHAGALAALESTGAPPGELAGHALAAELPAPALRWSSAAATAARRSWANVEAAEHYRRARVLAEAHPELLGVAAREELLVDLGRVLVALGRVEEAEAALVEARASAENRGDEQAAFAALEGLAVARQRGASDPVGALALGREALEVADRLGDVDLTARSHTLVGSPSGSLGLLDDEIAHCLRAVTIAEEAGRAPAAYPMGRVALGLHHQGRERDALSWVERAEVAAIEQHDGETLLIARWVRALACGALGRGRDAWEALDACAEVGRGEEVFWQARIPNTYGSILADMCLYPAALERDLESLEAARTATASPVREAEFQTRLNLATDHLGLGDPDAAADQLAHVRAGLDDVVYARFRWLPRLRFLEAELAVAAGAAEDALAAADACLALAAESGQAKYEVRGRLAQALAHLAAARSDQALEASLAAARGAEEHGFGALAWRCWSAADEAGGGPAARRNAQAGVLMVADGLDEPLRTQFLGAVPVRP